MNTISTTTQRPYEYEWGMFEKPSTGEPLHAKSIPDERIYSYVKRGRLTADIINDLHGLDGIPVKVAIAKIKQMVNKQRLEIMYGSISNLVSAKLQIPDAILMKTQA